VNIIKDELALLFTRDT